MKKRAFSAVLAAMVVGAAAARADIWTQADNLFAQRENDRNKIAQARTEYLTILNQVTTAGEKVRAVAQLGRLAVYEGEMLLPKTASAERKAIFGPCWCAEPKVTGVPPLVSGSCKSPGFVDKISPAAIGQNHPAYYYFRGVCLAYWGEQGSLAEKLAFTPWINDTLTEGLKLDTRYEGGGVERLAAGVYSNPAAKPLGLYKPAEALNLVNKALGEESYPGDPSNGANYYDNWQGKASVLRQLHEDTPNGGYKQQAITLVTDTLTEMDDRIANDDLPAGRGAEFQFNYGKLKTHYKELTGDNWP